MSLASKMKEMEEANAMQTEQIAELEAKASELIEAGESFKAEAEAKISDMQAKIDELEEAKAAEAEKAEVASKELEDVKGELETATAKLANPAHQDASAEGEEAVEPGAPAPEAEVDQEAVAKAEAQATIDAYLATPEGGMRGSWLKEHGAELQAAYNLLNVEG